MSLERDKVRSEERAIFEDDRRAMLATIRAAFIKSWGENAKTLTWDFKELAKLISKAWDERVFAVNNMAARETFIRRLMTTEWRGNGYDAGGENVSAIIFERDELRALREVFRMFDKKLCQMLRAAGFSDVHTWGPDKMLTCIAGLLVRAKLHNQRKRGKR